jgi:hypothetical protein
VAPAVAAKAVAAPTVTQPAAAPATPRSTPVPAAIKSSSPAVVALAATARVVAVPIKSQPSAAPTTPKPTPTPAAIKSSSPPAKAKPTNEITTVIGATYKNVQVEKVEPDGITISYTPARGGMGIIKINFDELSDELRQKYGFDPEKKKAYEHK